MPGGLPGADNLKEDKIVVVDKNIVTSRVPSTALEFGLEILRELGYNKEAEEIKEGMMINFYNKTVK